MYVFLVNGVCVCCVFVCGLRCPNIWGEVSVGSQGDGGRRSMIPDSGGVCWWCLGILYIGDRVVVDGVVVFGWGGC